LAGYQVAERAEHPEARSQMSPFLCDFRELHRDSQHVMLKGLGGPRLTVTFNLELLPGIYGARLQLPRRSFLNPSRDSIRGT
jgi:hypothetical protein